MQTFDTLSIICYYGTTLGCKSLPAKKKPNTYNNPEPSMKLKLKLLVQIN